MKKNVAHVQEKQPRFRLSTWLIASVCLSLASLSGSDLVADTISYARNYSYLLSASNGPAAIDYETGPTSARITASSSDRYGSYVMNYSATATAARGSLHAGGSVEIVPSGLPVCPPTCPVNHTPTTLPYFGINPNAGWSETDANVITLGAPDLLAGAKALEFTFNVHGSFGIPVSTGTASVQELAAYTDRITQNGVTNQVTDYFSANPAGPYSFFLQPPDLSQPFDFNFQLDTWVLIYANSVLDGRSSGSIDFLNSVNLVGVSVVDTNNNIIPGLDVELSDGTILPSANAPEPADFAYCGICITLFSALQNFAASKGRSDFRIVMKRLLIRRAL